MTTENLSYGAMHITSTAATTTVANTPVKAAGTTTGGLLDGFTHIASNRLRYDRTTTRVFGISIYLSMSSSGATQSKIFIYKNGILVPGTTIRRKISTGGDIGALPTGGVVSLATNDYIELWVETDDGDDLTVEEMHFRAKVLG